MTEMERRINELELSIKELRQQEDNLRSDFYAAKRGREVALIQVRQQEEQDLRTDHIIVPPEPVFPSKELRKIRHQSAKQYAQLTKLNHDSQAHNDPEHVPMTPNYVDIMISWGNMVLALWGFAIIVGLSVFLAAGESLSVGLFGSALAFGAVWLPGIVLATVLPDIRDALSETNSAYQHARGIFGYGSKIGWKRFQNLKGEKSFWASILTVYLAIIAVFYLVSGCFSDPCLEAAIITGAILSWGGTLVVSIILIRDAIHGRRLARQVF